MPMQNTLTLPVNHSGPVKNEFSSSFAVSEQDKLNFLIEELLEAGKEKAVWNCCAIWHPQTVQKKRHAAANC